MSVKINKKMIFRSFIITALAGLSLYTAGIFPLKNNSDQETMIIQAVKAVLDQVHFDPKNMDDTFSEDVFETYLKMLDGSKRFLTQKDIQSLEVYKYKLDDQILKGDLEFFERSAQLFDLGLQKTKAFYPEILDKPFDFNVDESLDLDLEKRKYAKNDQELKEFWRKLLKYETLTRLASSMESNEKSENPKSMVELEKDAREKVKKIFSDFYTRMEKIRRSDRFELYVDAIAQVYDPHTDYFSVKEKEDFDIRMGNKLEGIGARLQSEDDYTKVVSIIVGGPAWKDKELEVNDLIMQVAQEGEEYVNVIGMHLEDVVQLIRGKKGTKVKLQVKRSDGSTKEITIERDEVIIEEGKAKSAIMMKETQQKKFGYISLPSFYLDFEDPNGSSCADDIAKELSKLKADNVDGIVLDLRFNGGGSLTDVVEMAGFFIEEGPIVQVKPRGRQAYVYNDTDRGDVKYDGPLVILVNSYSVSASEILAAAMQDYGRAVIVGSPSTFGKGTVQRFFNLDDAVPGNSKFKPLGELKATTQKFYRINGGSTQMKGVESDIVLPDPYVYMDSGEKELPTAMKWSSIDSRQYNQNVYKVSNLTQLKSKSEERVNKNPRFKAVMEQGNIIKELKEKNVVALHLDKFLAEKKKNESTDKKYEDLLDQKIDQLEIFNPKSDMEYIQSDTSRVARNNDWIKSLNSDIYADEAINILYDMVKSPSLSSNTK